METLESVLESLIGPPLCVWPMESETKQWSAMSRIPQGSSQRRRKEIKETPKDNKARLIETFRQLGASNGQNVAFPTDAQIEK